MDVDVHVGSSNLVLACVDRAPVVGHKSLRVHKLELELWAGVWASTVLERLA